ncbi:MAG: VCBS repeat-containing protein [Planctomycetes bacterium]|nr:VCBS repeat-containing protein [Planctomycetota bacterium]
MAGHFGLDLARLVITCCCRTIGAVDIEATAGTHVGVAGPSPRERDSVNKLPLALSALLFISSGQVLASDNDHYLHDFQRIQLTDRYFSEGANIGDLNRDGVMDVVSGPYWFEGPDFQKRHEIYPPREQNRQQYADNFFSWVYDFNGDGWNDVFVVGFPGTPAYVYENPGTSGHDKHWTRQEVFDWVSNESPHFTNLVGDRRPELVCSRDGYFGYATPDWSKPFQKWTFHGISDQVTDRKFGHGLGVGDIDGDGRLDVLTKDGWFQQPQSLEGDPKWRFHPVEFTRAGGADMYAYDVDGDGYNDVITSLAAHEFGLAWFQQYREDGEIKFRRHLIMGSKPEENRYGLVFSELHTVALADMDGDGLKDIVTGKTYWSHHTQAPMWDAGAVVYWFKLVRNKDGVDWIPFRADGDSGVGRQVIVGDVNGDGVPDIVAGGMKGVHVLIHRRKQVDEATWRLSLPQPHKPLKAGLPPIEAAEHMTVPAGFRVKLAAGEPQVHQPIAMALDHRGRVWVAEAYNYPLRAPEGKGKDRIIILEDTDGDGTLDSRKVFIEGLNLVSGLEVGFGGVWVGAAPYLLFIPDRDGDDRPDGEPQVLLDGFGFQDTHETLNSFVWGPDGWLYGCHGVFTHSRVGKPGTPDNERTPINAGVWRYHPTRHVFEVFAWGTSNPWGVDFNDYGQAFATACVIPHLWHVVQGARYHRQAGQHFDSHAYDDIKTIADHSHYAGNIGEHAWWGHEPVTPAGTLAAGGGHAHCGAMVYLGDNWPAQFRNRILMSNIHGNRVNSDVLERRGSGFVGHHGPDMLVANDRWFRGINLKYGPDGSVYVIDWYDPNACHRTNPEIWDRTNGRIYNVAWGEPQPVHVDLAKLPDAELVKLHLHQNDLYARMARRLLQERATAGRLAKDTAPALRQMAREHADVTRQLRAIWTLYAIGALTEADGLALLADANEYVRAWTIQLELEDRAASSPALARLAAMAKDDPSPIVRLYLASALQRLPLAERWPIAESLVRHSADAGDHNQPLMCWYGIEPLVSADPSRALALADASQIPLVRRYIIRRAASDNQSLDLVANSLTRTTDAESRILILDEMLRAFEGRVGIPMPPAWTPAYEKLSRSDSQAVRDRADRVAVVLGDQRIFPRMRALLSDPKAELGRRREALEILVRGRDKDAARALQSAVGEPELRGPAIRALAAYNDDRTPAAVVTQYSKLSDEEKRDAVNTLVSRPSYALAMLDAIEKNKLPRTDVHAYNVQQLLRFNDSELNERIKAVWGEIRESTQDKKEQIARYKSLLTESFTKTADLGNGRRLFIKTCATCHMLFGEGDRVGPDITGSNRANLDYILENVVDPSAVLGKDYRLMILALRDGRVVSGLIQKETDSALTVRTINDTVVVAKADVEEQKLSDQSMMPEKLLDPLSPEEVRDLIAYLASPTQVSLRGPRAPIDPKTGRVPDAIEGESMKIIRKTAGDARSQKMDPFSADRWSGADQLWWTGAKPGARLELELPVAEEGTYNVELVLTRARDYAIVQLLLDGDKLGEPIDLFNSPDVITTGVLTFESRSLTADNHKLSVEIVGANPKAIKTYMFGLDYVRLRRAATSQ